MLVLGILLLHNDPNASALNVGSTDSVGNNNTGGSTPGSNVVGVFLRWMMPLRRKVYTLSVLVQFCLSKFSPRSITHGGPWL